MSFKDCEYRRFDEMTDELYCRTKLDLGCEDLSCDNCKDNIHLNCTNYNPKKDMCLKWFEEDVSRLSECKEKTVFNDKELSRKWSN